MKKLLKITGITIIVLLAALITLPFLFKDKLIQLAKEEANKNLNAKVDFGAFDVSIISSFPNLRFFINDLNVVGVSDFSNDTLAYIKKLSLDINIMSVIKGDEIKIKEISIQEPKINALVLQNGKANWDITKPATDTKKETTASGEKTKFKLGLSLFEITKAQIKYNDKQADRSAAIYDFDFKLSGDFTQDHFLMNLFSEIQKLDFSMGGVHYAKNMRIKFKTGFDADMPNMKFTFKENEININELALGIEGFVAMPDTNINMDLKFLCKQTEFKNILSLVPAVYNKDFANVTTAGKLALTGFAKGTYNAKTIPAFGAHIEIANAMFKYPSLPKSVTNINILCDIENPNGKPDATNVDINKFHIAVADNPIDMVMHIKTPVSDPNLHGEIKGKIDLNSIKDVMPLEKGDNMSGIITADVKMKGKMSAITKKKYDEFKAEGSLEIAKMNYKTSSLPYSVFINEMKLGFTPQTVNLTSFDSRLGKSDINMKGKIENFMQYLFQDSLIKGAFTLNSNLLDLNELMSSSSNTGTKTAPTPSAATTNTAPSSTTQSVALVPKNIDFELNSDIKKIQYDKIEITHVAGAITVRNARASMSKVKMNLLDGSMLMDGFYDTKNTEKPTIYFNLNMSDIDVQKTVSAFNTVEKLAPVAKSVQGKFSATLNNLNGTLKQDMSPDLNTLSGDGAIKAKALAIKDFEPLVKLDDALRLNKLKTINLNDINVFYEFKEGRVTTKPFKINVAGVPAEVSGSTGFDQTIDYKWLMQVPTKIIGAQAQQAVQGLLSKAGSVVGTNFSLPENIDVTALIGGTITKPTVKVVPGKGTGNISVAQQVKEAVVNEVKQVASQKAEELLAAAQKQADALKAEAARLSQQAREAGYRAADSLVSAVSNPLAKIAAKKAAEKLKQEADIKAKKINDEAASKADKIIADAQAQADKLK
ncbi:MAG: hypothetical protein JST67_04335 [Bacteroidetes bacterium]|nr:hypothetical protein [Bacteroidota bacterium]